MSAHPPSGGFSLFPNTIVRPPSRSLSRPRGSSPQPDPQDEPSTSTRARPRSPSQNGRQTPQQHGQQSVAAGKQPASNGRQSAMDGRTSAFDNRDETTIEPPAPVADPPARCDTAFSEARTLVRSNSNRSRSSIAKPPLSSFTSSPAEQSEPPRALRSIFPQYNPELPADRQEYYPTQTSPTHIPRGAISRPLYSPTESAARSPAVRSPVRSPPVRSPKSTNSTARWPPKTYERPAMPDPSTTEELKSLWKVTNGWKASGSEGRVYCLKMTAEKDCPSYTLSSSTQPFYNLRVDPTSASAHISLSRHDPTRPYKGAAAGSGSGGSPLPPPSSKTDGKNWQEVLTSTLEADARRFQPEDGLVALLWPAAAAKVAAQRPDDGNVVDMAERECARLVWDDDSGNYYLVHPALALPFCVTVERSPAWSRTEYTLEHLESPQHLARLTRDGTGAGWLEVDTAIAAKIDSVYLVDVAVAALTLVAHKDADGMAAEFFEPPPSVFGGGGDGNRDSQSSRNERRASRMSRASKSSARRDEQRRKAAGSSSGGGGRAKRSRMEEFELDIESQTSELNKTDVKDKDKLPGTARGVIKLLTVTFKCFIWVLTIGFKALTGTIALLAKCLTSEKL